MQVWSAARSPAIHPLPSQHIAQLCRAEEEPRYGAHHRSNLFCTAHQIRLLQPLLFKKKKKKKTSQKTAPKPTTQENLPKTKNQNKLPHPKQQTTNTKQTTPYEQQTQQQWPPLLSHEEIHLDVKGKRFFSPSTPDSIREKSNGQQRAQPLHLHDTSG